MPDWEEPPETEAVTVEDQPKKRGRPPGSKTDGRTARKEERHRQDKAQKKLSGLAADLEPIIDQQVRLVEWHQQAMVNETTQGRAALQQHFTEDDAKKLATLTKMVEGLGDLKIRWLAAAQKLGAGLTPLQVLEGAIGRIMALSADERLKVIHRLYAMHNAVNKPGAFAAGAEILGVDQRGIDGRAALKVKQEQPAVADLNDLLGEKKQ